LMNISSTTAINIQNGSGSPIFQVNSASTEAGIDLTAVAAQSANLLNLYNSSSVFLSGFTAAGGLLMNISSTTAIALQNGSGSAVFTVPSNSVTATTTLNTGINIDGNTLVVNANENRVGVGVANPTYKFMVDWNGDGTNAAYVNNSNAWTAGSADYAEFFYSITTNFKPGEAVCVDVTRNNAVKRCERGADPDLMGVISTSPAVLGNAPEGREKDPNYVIVGMLGQVPALVSIENGEIRPGDSLTSASSTPGYLMRANAGDSTVGVALESLAREKGTINVLISRRNKSLSVEQVEEQITKRVAEMEIEDEVNIMVADAMKLLGMDEQLKQNSLKVMDLENNFEIISQKIDQLQIGQIQVKANDSVQIGNINLALDPNNQQKIILANINNTTSTVELAVKGNISAEKGFLSELILSLRREQNSLATSTATTNGVVMGDSIDNPTTEDISIKVIESLNGDVKLSVSAGAEFAGKVTVKDMVVSGKITVYDIATFKNNIVAEANLELAGAIIRNFNENTSTTLAIGDAVFVAGTNLVDRAYADDPAFKPAIGMVVGFEETPPLTPPYEGGDEEVLSSVGEGVGGVRTVKVAIGGTVNGFKDLVPGARYYLSELNYYYTQRENNTTVNTSTVLTLASLTLVAPTNNGSALQAIAVAVSESELLLMPSLDYSFVGGEQAAAADFGNSYADQNFLNIRQELDNTLNTTTTPEILDEAATSTPTETQPLISNETPTEPTDNLNSTTTTTQDESIVVVNPDVLTVPEINIEVIE